MNVQASKSSIRCRTKLNSCRYHAIQLRLYIQVVWIWLIYIYINHIQTT